MKFHFKKNIRSQAWLPQVDGLFDSFDFAVFDDSGNLDFLIEYQGIQHYQAKSKFGGSRGLYQQQYNDNLKRRFCMEHGITLIEIPYSDEAFINYNYIMQKAGY